MSCLREYRCTSCKNLLYKGLLVEGEIEIKCKKCHTMNTIVASKFDDYMCLVYPCPHRIVLPKKQASETDIPKSHS